MSQPQFNLGYFCARQHVDAGHGDRIALRWIAPTLERTDISFQALEQHSNRFANVLRSLGVEPGQRVFTFLPPSPELYFAVLGILKTQAVSCVLFSNFGEEALLTRLADAQARIVLTKKSLLRKLRGILGQLPALRGVLVVDLPEDESDLLLSYPQRMACASDQFDIPLTAADTPSVLHYTSGSTGKPKGVLHCHQSLLTQSQTFIEVLNVREGDIYWCTADPAWVTGTTYGILAPWNAGITQVQFGGSFSAQAWFTILQRQGVNIWYTAPTALRMLMQEEDNFYRSLDLSALRHIFSVGEPLNPEVIAWGRRVLGKEIYDTWFQTETGAIMIANKPGLPIRPGSMGKPVTGIRAAILDEHSQPVLPGEKGNLCLQAGWHSMFTTYLNAHSAYLSKFRQGWYHSGDLAYQDEDGYFWFIGRNDDIINTAGHLVSPFEVESSLLEIPEVAESGVVGAPDDLLWEKVVAFIALRSGQTWSPELELKIRLHVSNKVSSLAAPREFRVVERIPKNKSGKIMRRVLRAWLTGQDAGDLSTLED